MPGVSISPNKIQAYPIGDADITLQSLLENSIGWVVVSQSSASVFPRRAVISVDFPPGYTLKAGNASTLAVTYRDAVSHVYTADANYQIEVLPVTRYDVKTDVDFNTEDNVDDPAPLHNRSSTPSGYELFCKRGSACCHQRQCVERAHEQRCWRHRRAQRVRNDRGFGRNSEGLDTGHVYWAPCRAEKRADAELSSRSPI